MSSLVDDDDLNLEVLGYKPSFRREFSNLATISFAFSIMGLCSSVATTFNYSTSVTWCWILGSCMCFTLGSSIAEIVSAFPTCGGLYTASAQLCPPAHRPVVGWTVGWLNMLGQVAGISSTEFGLTSMIWAAVSITSPGFVVTPGKTVGLFTALLIIHGTLNSRGFVFVNIGTTLIIIIVLLAMTPRSEMHAASYVFGSQGVINQTGGWNNGIAFLLGLLSVQWTDYDATAHISEEVRRAAYAVIGTGILGWILNIVMVLCSGPIGDLPGVSGSAFLQVRPQPVLPQAFVCLTAFFVVQTALQACSRTIYAFSRDHGFPDNGYFGHISGYTQTPLRSIWLTTVLSILPGLLDLASPVAANAIFALTAMALDLSYIIPIFLRRLYANHPEVHFQPGPFYMGSGILGWAANVTLGVVVLSGIWYILSAHRHYHGPMSNLDAETKAKLGIAGKDDAARDSQNEEEKKIPASGSEDAA
ncbi:amino acid/polyamine transporter I [Melanogaster broomeanus]|nr:amino acid/polyamine transporter I [Melanogaster broomeanus]